MHLNKSIMSAFCLQYCAALCLDSFDIKSEESSA